jgi:hypothetical protein
VRVPGQGAVKLFADLAHQDADYVTAGGRRKPETIDIAEQSLNGQDYRLDVV